MRKLGGRDDGSVEAAQERGGAGGERWYNPIAGGRRKGPDKEGRFERRVGGVRVWAAIGGVCVVRWGGLGGCWCIVVYLLLIVSELLRIPGCPASVALERGRGCNGDVELCVRRYNKVAFATAHNAFANTQAGFLVAQNRGCLEAALVGGMRGFMLDVHLTRTGEILICHVSCQLGSVSVGEALKIFRDFLQVNREEVVTIFWEFGFDMQERVGWDKKERLCVLLDAEIRSSGVVPFVYRHADVSDEWPTLGTMVAQNTRLVLFADTLYDDVHLFLSNTRTMVVQTEFENYDIRDLQKECMLRGWRFSNSLIVINHFTMLGALGVNAASTERLAALSGVQFFANINRNPFLAARVHRCAEDIDEFPSFVAVDFWESSDIVQVVRDINRAPSSVVPCTQKSLRSINASGLLHKGMLSCP